MKISVPSCENSAIGICPDSKFSNLEYSDEVVLLGEDPRKVHVSLYRLDDSVAVFVCICTFKV